MFGSSPEESNELAPAAVGAPRRVRDPQALECAIRTWCFHQGRRPDPETEVTTSITWWDSADGQLHARGIQLVLRQQEGRATQLEAIAADRRRSLQPHAIGHWLIRGRALVPLLRIRSVRRCWTGMAGEGLEWVQWEGPGGGEHASIGARGEDDAARRFLESGAVRPSLHSAGSAPSWPDHALHVVQSWLAATTHADPALGFTAAAQLQRELRNEDSALVAPMTEYLTELFARESSGAPIAGAPEHPVWRHAVRDALHARPLDRMDLLDRLATALRAKELASMRDDVTRLRAATIVLVAAEPWIDAPARKSVRELRAYLALAEQHARLDCTNALLADLVRSNRVPPEAALEAGTRLRRSERELLLIGARLESLGPPRVRPQLRGWARARRRELPRPGES